jgi:hypothetical protein
MIKFSLKLERLSYFLVLSLNKLSQFLAWQHLFLSLSHLPLLLLSFNLSAFHQVIKTIITRYRMIHLISFYSLDSSFLKLNFYYCAFLRKNFFFILLQILLNINLLLIFNLFIFFKYICLMFIFWILTFLIPLYFSLCMTINFMIFNLKSKR